MIGTRRELSSPSDLTATSTMAHRRRARWLCSSAAIAALSAGCTFTRAGGPDLDLCAAPSTSCASDTVLRTCAAEGATAVETECAWGCVSAAATARCGTLMPAGGVITPLDFDPAGLADIVLTDTTINTDDGEILGVRPRDPGVKNGIDFQKPGNASVFRLKSLRITGTVLLAGRRAIAIVAQEAITLEGLVDGRGDPICANAGKDAGPGGFDGGNAKSNAAGPGGGAGTSAGDSGGGGGGHGGTGGTGGGTGGAGGLAFGRAELSMLVGGGGGGGGGSGNASGTGGGGGAALQLASGTSITIAATGDINAGGCGGDQGDGGSDGGGGGGAGGTILLEAPRIVIAGRLAVNGGGGGTRLGFGGHATLGRTPAPGGIAPTTANGNGGPGGAGATLAGGMPVGGTFGAGGGAVGRMRFHTREGTVTVEAGAVLSPALDDSPTTTTQAPARVE